MKDDKIVVRCKDKQLMKGKVHDFTPEKVFFNMRLLTGECVKIKTEDLKAIFLVKDYKGNKDYTYSYKDVLLWGGMKIRITFNDSERMIGYVPYHINSDRGFFVTPADLNGNNKKVFVIKSAVREILYM